MTLIFSMVCVSYMALKERIILKLSLWVAFFFNLEEV